MSIIAFTYFVIYLMQLHILTINSERLSAFVITNKVLVTISMTSKVQRRKEHDIFNKF